MLRLTNKKYMVPGLVAALVMFGLSFFWHSLFLNDFNRIVIPKSLFYSALLVSYLGISILMTFIYSSDKVNLGKHFSGFVIGLLMGFLVYAIALTLGFSFNNSLTFLQGLVDVSWQMFEQAIGGLVIAIGIQIAENGGIHLRV